MQLVARWVVWQNESNTENEQYRTKKAMCVCVRERETEREWVCVFAYELYTSIHKYIVI